MNSSAVGLDFPSLKMLWHREHVCLLCMESSPPFTIMYAKRSVSYPSSTAAVPRNSVPEYMCIFAERAGKIEGKLSKINILKKVVGKRRISGSISV